MTERNYRNIRTISFSQFGLSFSFNFVLVFLPFFIHKVSPYSPTETLLWVGLIMGAASGGAAIFSTFWGALTDRFSRKALYMGGMISHIVIILAMACVSNLPLFFVLRIIQGILGGISTVGLVIVSASSNQERASEDIGLFQNAMTLGQLIGPPAGAFAASLFGYKGAFITASALIFLVLMFCSFYVTEPPRRPREKVTVGRRTLNRKTLTGWGLCFTATVQLMFLPSVLPDVFHAFAVERATALRLAGIVVMAYTGTAMIGTLVLCKWAAGNRGNRLMVSACIVGIALQSLLALSPGILSFVAVRMLQTAAVAAIPPLIFALFAMDLDAKVMGFLNSARFAGNALGPIVGTAILAASNLTWLYLSVSGVSLLALLGFAFFSPGAVGVVASPEIALDR